MNLNLTAATRYGLNVLGFLGIAVALYLGASILIPLVISALLATILYPLAKWLNARGKLPWFVACLSTILILVAVAALVFSTIGVSVVGLVYQLPQDERAWQDQYDKTVTRLRDDMPFLTPETLPNTYALGPDRKPLTDAAGKPVRDQKGENAFRTIQKAFSVESLTPYLMKFAGYGAGLVGETVLVLFVILFLLLEAELLATKVRAIFGTSSENQRRVVEALGDMAESIRTYLVWRTIVNIGLGVVLGVFYKYVIGLEHWLLWAVVTAALSYVPYIGTIAAGVPPIFDALIFSPHPAQAAGGIAVFYTALVTFEGYWIVPRVMGKHMDLNATTVMVSCLFWNLVWGIAGLFLAMPLMAAIKAVMMNVDGWQPWGDLLGSVDTTPAAPPPEALDKRPDVGAKTVRDGDLTVTDGKRGPA